jgi:hypothetical protein
MHLYGWSFGSFLDALGSKNAAVLSAATALLSEAIDNGATRARGQAWLKTLIETGFPLAKDRKPSPQPDGGGLMTMLVETEAHVFAIHSLVRAIARGNDLNLSEESQSWTHPAVSGLYNELASLGFSRPTNNDPKRWFLDYIRWMSGLSNGTPLFGDDFRSEWSFYTCFNNPDLAAMIPVLQAATEFQKRLPDDMPEEVRREYKTSLSEGSKAFVTAFTKWLTQIQQAGQDAFILWW